MLFRDHVQKKHRKNSSDPLPPLIQTLQFQILGGWGMEIYPLLYDIKLNSERCG
jgi:hypothetical protein